MGTIIVLITKMKCKEADNTLEQCFLEEFKATCKNPSESEINKTTKRQSEMHQGQFRPEPFNLKHLQSIQETAFILLPSGTSPAALLISSSTMGTWRKLQRFYC